ncbi:hypothetical protein SAMN04488137_1647 [Fictibacillus solisalsi]|uniref:Uncharacterized protein n=1 Tax=Fictibacillus solisalsi TaxID=459525 RepID=A0A1G9VKI2_9BACL|nr:hypothetical protein [Fictibacillus solisalsi]SDM72679.1 hypothetical protein SAMN04488137_1647 [Fictibacillus solisalsi]
MKLYQVRKGQFVYFNNELHRVYGVKHMYKQSVHLIRLRDLTQHLTNAVSVEKYKPKELDSFIFNHKEYTLRSDQKAQVGDYVLIHNPMPDSLDTYSLNEIDEVETVDAKGVMTSRSHGIKHNEYMLMVPGRSNNSHAIDYQDINRVPDHLQNTQFSQPKEEILPTLGDIYRKHDSNEPYEAMVIAITGSTVFLGNGLQLSQKELMNTDQWELLYNLLDN